MRQKQNVQSTAYTWGFYSDLFLHSRIVSVLWNNQVDVILSHLVLLCLALLLIVCVVSVRGGGHGGGAA